MDFVILHKLMENQFSDLDNDRMNHEEYQQAYEMVDHILTYTSQLVIRSHQDKIQSLPTKKQINLKNS